MKEEKIIRQPEQPEKVELPLDIPFKEFMPGQIIESEQFNDDMKDIEDKVNEVVSVHNALVERVYEHQYDYFNPHAVTAHQTGTYTGEEIDVFVDDLKNGNLNDGAIENRVLADGCIDGRVIKDGCITVSKTDSQFGNQLNISNNISITDRYTKTETDQIIQDKVGDGTYSKEQIDGMFEDYQAGTIIDNTIDASKLKDDVGQKIDISANPSILDRYSKAEVNNLITKNGLPKDWGNLEEVDEGTPPSAIGHLPIANIMVADEFPISETPVLNIDVKEVIDARGDEVNLKNRLDGIDTQISAITINVKNFGAKGDGLSDDTISVQNAINSAKVGDKVLIPPGIYSCNGLVINKAINVECLGELKQNNTIGTLVTIGDYTNKLEGFKGNLKLRRSEISYTHDNIGIKILNCDSACIDVDQCVNFTKGIVLEGNGRGCAYNSLQLGSIKNNKISLELISANNGWANENKFNGGRFSWTSGNTEEGKIHINITDKSQNNNVFFSPSLENDGLYFIKCEGIYNTFYSPRLEGTPNGSGSSKVYFGEDSYSNNILYPYFSFNFDTDKIVNNGRFNKFYGRYTTDMNGGAIINTMVECVGNPSSNPDIESAPLTIANISSSTNKALIVKDPSLSKNVYSVDGKGVVESGLQKLCNTSSSSANALEILHPSTKDVRCNVDGQGNLTSTSTIKAYKFECTSTQGIFLKSANGTLWRIVVSDTGTLTVVK